MKARTTVITLLAMIALAGVHACLAGSNGSAATAAVPSFGQADWVLRLPADGDVGFEGVANFNDAGVRQSGMLYPAPSALGMLAAVATHAALVKSSRRTQKEKIQKQADKVLDPYRSALASFTFADLGQRASAFVVEKGYRSPLPEEGLKTGAWLVISTPAFAMTQDRSALVLDNTIAIFAPGPSEHHVYANVVRVVSDPRSPGELPDAWAADDGKALKDESARLLAYSLDVAFADAQAGRREAPYRTVRYIEGSGQRMERGQVLGERCGRALLRTLRDTLMSVPVHDGTDGSPDPGCKREAPVAGQGIPPQAAVAPTGAGSP